MVDYLYCKRVVIVCEDRQYVGISLWIRIRSTGYANDRIIVLYKNEVSEQSNNPNTNLLTNNWCSFYTEALHVHYSFA